MGQRQQSLDQQQYQYANEPYRRQQDMQDRLAYEASHAQQEFTINDQLQLQRLQNDRQSIDAAVTSGQLLPEDAKQMYADLATPISVYQRRKAATDQKKEEQQVELLKKQNEHQAVGDATYKSFMAKASADGITTVPDPDNPDDVLRDHVTGAPLQFQWSHKIGGMIPLEKPATAARAHSGWTDKQIDDAAHAQTAQSRPEWQADPKAAKMHPDYLGEYSKRRSGMMDELFKGETTKPDENGDRWYKDKDGGWKVIEASKAAQAALKPEKPPVTVPQYSQMVTAEVKALTTAKDSEGKSPLVGAGRDFTNADGSPANTTPTTRWSDMPHLEVLAEAQRIVDKKIQDHAARVPGATPATRPQAGPPPTPGPPSAQAATGGNLTPDEAAELAKLEARKAQLANQRLGVAPRPDPGFGMGGYGG